MQDASQSGTLDENQNSDNSIIQRETDETEPAVEAAKEDAEEGAKNDAEEAAAIERLKHINYEENLRSLGNCWKETVQCA